jgi:membrane protein involved in colicin uptake
LAKVDAEIDRLYDLPLDEFTAARNELAKRLTKEGDAESAERVRTLVKPSVPAWTINQLARRNPEAVRTLLNVGARLRAAQERSLRGEPAADELRGAQAEEREAVRKLTQQAGALLRDAGRPATAATLDRVSSTLRAAALAEPGRTLLRDGRLDDEVEVSGFDAFSELQVPKSRGKAGAAKTDDLAERRRQKREAERRRRELEKRVRELSARAESAEREAERARKAAAEAESIAAERRREADAAAAELTHEDEKS